MAFRTYTCPIAKSCGGCELLAVPYPIQLRRKNDYVRQLFSAELKATGTKLLDIVGMDEPKAFRYKAATPFAPGPKGRVRSGFYARGTHRIVPCTSCLVEESSLRDVLNSVTRVAAKHHISAYDEDRGRGFLRHAIVRTSLYGSETLLTLVANGEHMSHLHEFMGDLLHAQPQLTSVVLNINKRQTNAMLGDKNQTLYGPGVMHDKLLGCTFEIGPSSFYQTNPKQTEVLYQLALEAAQLSSGQTLLDAYCGCGTIGLTAASQVPDIKLLGVERTGEAIQFARRNARVNQLEAHARFVCDDATHYLAHSDTKVAPDVIILDPPRAGSTPQFLKAAASTKAERIVYISCNPQTQVRDLQILRASGYKLEYLQAVDMFPHTKHIECIALLVRTKA